MSDPDRTCGNLVLPLRKNRSVFRSEIQFYRISGNLRGNDLIRASSSCADGCFKTDPASQRSSLA